MDEQKIKQMTDVLKDRIIDKTWRPEKVAKELYEIAVSKDREKQKCVICHTDITEQLPKIDIYGNNYCKSCYHEKVKYERMEEEYDIAMYDQYKLGFMDGSDKTAKEIVTKLEQLQRCLKQVALNELIRSLEKQYGLVDLPVSYCEITRDDVIEEVVDTPPLICARCGKEIGTGDYFVKLRQSDPFNGHEECYWCEDCYDDFKKDLGE